MDRSDRSEAGAQWAEMLCHIDEVSPRRVRGWLYSGVEAVAPPRLRVFVDDEEIIAVVPDLPREDVVAAGFGRLRVGFCFRIPGPWFDGRMHMLRLRLDDGSAVRISLRGEIAAVCPFQEAHEPLSIVSNLDGISGGHLHGWVLRAGEPAALLEGGVAILVTCARKMVGEYVANRPRADVGAIFGDAVSPPLCGFVAYIPKLYRLAVAQSFRVLTAREGVEITGSPVVFSFP